MLIHAIGCYGHALNLAVADAIKSVPCTSDSLDTVREIGKLVKKVTAKKHKVKIRAETKNESRGVHAFCPTRWTVRGEALAAVINNHAELMELWDWSLIVSKDTEIKAIRGVQSMMTTFNFYFGQYPGRATSEVDRQRKSRLARFIHLNSSR